MSTPASRSSVPPISSSVSIALGRRSPNPLPKCSAITPAPATHSADSAEARAARRPRHAARQRDHRRDPRHRSGRPPGRDRGRGDRQQGTGDDDPPRDRGGVDPVRHDRLDERRERDPRQPADEGAEDARDDTDQGAGRRHREPEVALGRPDRGQHAELGEPALGEDGEGGGGDEGHERQHHGAREQRQHAGQHVLGDVTATRDADPAHLVAEPAQRVLVRRHEHRDRVGVVELRRFEQHELVVEVARVLDDPDDLARRAVEIDRVADAHPEQIGDAVGDGRLAVVTRNRDPTPGRASGR